VSASATVSQLTWLPPCPSTHAELKLTSYSFESCVAAVLQLRVPHVPHTQLHAWFAGGAGAGRWRCLDYFVRRARLNLALLDQLDLVGRTGEMARAFGIDFFSGARWMVVGL
jgi:DNA polymerase zeta